MNIKYNLERQHDDSVWKRYQTPKWVEIIVTSAFREIMQHGQPNPLNDGHHIPKGILALLRKYRISLELNQYDHHRTTVASWNFATVFRIWESNICIREEDNAWKCEDQIHRMDLIQHLLDLGHIPRWIKSPIHYWLIKVPIMRHGLYNKYMVMEMIDDGVTAFDIVEWPRNDMIESAIIKNFWQTYNFSSLSDENYILFQNLVRDKYVEAKRLLVDAFKIHQDDFKWWTFEQLFQDLLMRNVLVTINHTRVWWSPLTLWIIDQ